MSPSKATSSWDDEDSESTPPSSPPTIARRKKFDDEEDDSDVIESWDAAEDSEVEREKAKKAAEAKAKAEAEAKAKHKSKSQRIEEKRQENLRRRQEAEDEEDESSEDEDEADRRARLRESEKASDLKNAEELFSDIGGVPESRGAAKAVTVREGDDPSNAIDLSSLKLFNPNTVQGFVSMRETIAPLLLANSKKAQYELFVKEFTKQLVRDMNSEQIKKVASGLTTISNEKLKEEKAADKGGKKTKAAKTKNSLSANRDITNKADITAYDGGLNEYVQYSILLR